MKILADGECRFCHEHHGDQRCSIALGKAVGQLKRIETLKTKRAWTCPPMPMPDPIVAEVEGVIVILPPVPEAIVDPPLTAAEVKRAAIFMLSGQVREVTEAILKVRATPWPAEEEGGS